MKGNYSLYLVIFIALIFSFISCEYANAGSAHNIYGWAWSENIGWISFNSTNCDPDQDGISEGPATVPPASAGCSVGSSVPNYGVNVNKETGIFNGYAWADSVGWITFNEAELAGCPTSPDCRAETDFTEDPREIFGWARALATGGGWDGWIRLRDTKYTVWVDTDVTPTEFKSWAWADNFPVIGWISFNCSNEGCTNSNYKVLTLSNFNQSPSAIPLPVTPGDDCDFSYPPIIFNWVYSDPNGDLQSAYQVQIDSHGATFPSIEIDSGKISSSSGSYSPQNALLFNTTYSWRVMVWDSFDDSSVWAIGPPFTTEIHIFPKPQFSFTPSSPAVGELVNFLDSSKCYDSNNIEYSCSSNLGNRYEWDFGEGDKNCKTGKNIKDEYVCRYCDSNQDANCRGDVIHVYSIMGNFETTLTITDDIGTCISPAVIISPTPPLPIWIEINPRASIFNFFSRINGFVDFHFF